MHGTSLSPVKSNSKPTKSFCHCSLQEDVISLGDIDVHICLMCHTAFYQLSTHTKWPGGLKSWINFAMAEFHFTIFI